MRRLTKSMRNSNVEILRIVVMMLVIMNMIYQVIGILLDKYIETSDY